MGNYHTASSRTGLPWCMLRPFQNPLETIIAWEEHAATLQIRRF
jgi:hypothetical protein